VKNPYILFFLILLSCTYPDIDSVPDFEDLVITKEESIDLCKLTNTDNKSLSNCLDKIDNNQNK
tara:strand:- start:102 stop:293 length:192 start_codon:yes stop_codon:yes gene_type:complete